MPLLHQNVLCMQCYVCQDGAAPKRISSAFSPRSWRSASSAIQNADVLAAVTTRDDINLAICHFARLKYQIPRTIARVNNPRDAWLYTDVFSVDVPINQSDLMAQIIEEEMSMGDMMTLRFRDSIESDGRGREPGRARGARARALALAVDFDLGAVLVHDLGIALGLEFGLGGSPAATARA